MAAGIFHKLVLAGLQVGGNSSIWLNLLPDRKGLATSMSAALVIVVYWLANRWQVDLIYKSI